MRRYTIGEVCELLGTRSHVLRYWEQELPFLRPRKDEFGRRSYRENDLQQLYRLKYLIEERGMTLKGAGQRLFEDASGMHSDRLSAVREVRSSLLGLRETSHLLITRIAQAADAPSLIAERSDGADLIRRYKELDGAGRTRLLEQLPDFPDYWVDHVRRLSGPGGPLHSCQVAESSHNTQSARRLHQGRESTGDLQAKILGQQALTSGVTALVWWPERDASPPGEVPFSDFSGPMIIAVPRDRADRWERARSRWSTTAQLRLSMRFPLPELTPSGTLSIDETGAVGRSSSRLAAALSWLTLPHLRARILSAGVSTIGLVLPGAGYEVSPHIIGLHRLNHASVTLKLVTEERRQRIHGPLWLDLAFLAGFGRTLQTNHDDGSEESGRETIVPSISVRELLSRAALPQIYVQGVTPGGANLF